MRPGDILTLLDVDAMVPRLRAIPVLADGTARLRSAALERVWVKPGRHVHASYRVALDIGARTVETRAAAGLVRPDESAPEIERRALGVPDVAAPPGWPAGWDVRRSTAAVDGSPMLVQLFPWDYRLPTLSLALDPVRVEHQLGRVRLGRPRVAGYWPGIRCQIRYECADEPGGALYGKVFSGPDGAAVARRQRAIAARGPEAGFTSARVRAWLPALNLLVTEPVEGEPLPERLAQPDAGAVVPRVAAALAALHEISVPEVERRFAPADDLAVTRSWVTLTSGLFPDLAPDLAVALGALERRFPQQGNERPIVVHRDFYDKQVLLGSRGVALLDLDTACLGDGEIDVANFCAHLVLRALQSPSPAWDPIPLGEAFIEAYRTCRATSRSLLDWYRASALLRLACLYALRPRWRALAPHLANASRRGLEG